MTTLFVGNLPYSTTEEELRSVFAQAGSVENISMPIDRATGRKRGFAFVDMSNDRDANVAMFRLNGSRLDGRAMTVRLATPKSDRSNGAAREIPASH